MSESTSSNTDGPNDLADCPFRALPAHKRLQVMAVYYPTLAYNVVMGRMFKVRPWWNRVDESLILGALPFQRDVQPLYDQGVRGVINTCIEYPGPVSAYQQYGIEQLWTPTVDFTHPSLDSVQRGVDFIERFAARGESVYVHCKAGRARSATIALCWLVKARGLAASDAQRHLLEKRSHVNRKLIERPVVHEFVSGIDELSSSREPSAPE